MVAILHLKTYHLKSLLLFSSTKNGEGIILYYRNWNKLEQAQDVWAPTICITCSLSATVKKAIPVIEKVPIKVAITAKEAASIGTIATGEVAVSDVKALPVEAAVSDVKTPPVEEVVPAVKVTVEETAYIEEQAPNKVKTRVEEAVSVEEKGPGKETPPKAGVEPVGAVHVEKSVKTEYLEKQNI